GGGANGSDGAGAGGGARWRVAGGRRGGMIQPAGRGGRDGSRQRASGGWAVRAIFALLGVGLAALAVGCKDSGPKGQPVSGKVVFKDGDVQKLAGGYVRLESVADPKLKAVGQIEEDGTFVLGAFADDKRVAGVPEGRRNLARSAAPPGLNALSGGVPGVALRSTPGYRRSPLRGCRAPSLTLPARTDAARSAQS